MDIGSKVQMIMVDTGEGETDDEGDNVDDSIIYVRAQQEINPEEDIFLIDHMWTFKREQITTTLLENDSLRERMDNMLKS